MKELVKYNNMYLGKTIFIIGNGTELNSVDPELLKDQVVIGCNASHVWKSDPTFMIAGHAIFPMLWANNAQIKETGVFHGLPPISSPSLILNTRNRTTEYIQCFKNNVTEDDYLVGCDMVGFSATHLALIIGASDIVYIGFDSKYPNHFYDFHPYYERLKEQTNKIKTKPRNNHILKAEIFDFQQRHFPPGKNAMGFVLEHYHKNAQRFSSLFNILRNVYGVNIWATQEESITVTAGAIYKPLGELL